MAFKGYSRKHRKVRRSTRAGKRYGDTAEAHGNYGVGAARRAKEAAVEAAEFAEAGNCRAAIRYLNSAYGYQGHAVTHSASGGRGIELGTTSSTLSRAQDVVIDRCTSRRRR